MAARLDKSALLDFVTTTTQATVHGMMDMVDANITTGITLLPLHYVVETADTEMSAHARAVLYHQQRDKARRTNASTIIPSKK